MKQLLVLALLMTASASVYAEHRGAMNDGSGNNSNNGSGGGGMGGGMGGGGGGGGASYESKRDELSKSFEQPAQEARKSMTEGAQKFGQEMKSLLSDTNKAIQSNMAKDEKIDDKVSAALNPAPKPDDGKTKDAADSIVASIQELSKSSAALIQQQGQVLLNNAQKAQEEAAALRPLTLGERIAAASEGSAGTRTQGLASAFATRAPASQSTNPIDTSKTTTVGNHTPGATGDSAKGFRRGLLHNPPAGLELD